MPSKSKNFIIPLVVYPFDLMVSFGETDEQLFARLRKTNVKEDEFNNAAFDGDECKGRYCLFKCGASLIRLRHTPKTSADFGYLHHELFHAVSGIMWRIGVQLEIKVSDEAYAYLIGYLTEQIYTHI